MFHVLVLGGIGLVSAHCGGAVASSNHDASVGQDGFPGEGAAPPSGLDAFPTEGPAHIDAFPAEGAVEVDAFPTEGPVQVDAFPTEGAIAIDASADAFPTEGPPPPPDASADAGVDGSVDATSTKDAGFPNETAATHDAAGGH
jgi:hypothetical protein